MKQPVRCRYVGECYLADELRCYGYMTDCPLYMRTNDEPCNDARFDAAMDRLIARTKAKHDRLKQANGEINGDPQAKSKTQTDVDTGASAAISPEPAK